MDTPDDGRNLNADELAELEDGQSSSMELGKVKHVLSVKMEQPDSHYTTITPLGKGSFGEVHSAHDTLLGREVAIKSLKEMFRNEDEVVDRFLKEARGTSQLEHPNIMPVHEMGVTDELGIYFTMKKIHGDNLKEILDQLEGGTSLYQKKYPLNALLEIFLAVCNGVAFAHSKGVIHRDLKPANIMSGEYGEVLILDWGLVKQLNTKEAERSGVQLRMDEFDDGSRTLDGAISGTPNYMSPEQADGKVDEIDFQSDVYSLGAILYHLLTYLPPFEKTQLRKLLENVKEGNFEPPRKRRPELNIPRELEAICLKAMSRNQVSRYPSVEKLAEDIRNYISHRDVTAYKAPPLIRLWKACQRNPVKASVAAAVIIALGVAFGGQRAMFEWHYYSNVKTARDLKENAFVLVDEAGGLIQHLEQLCADTMVKKKSDEEEAAIIRLEELVRQVNIQFTIARSYLDNIPERLRRRQTVRELYVDIALKRIDFAFARGDLGQVEEILDEAEKRFDLMNADIPADAQGIIDSTRERIIGNASLRITASDNVEQVFILGTKEVGGRIQLDEDTAIARRRPPIDKDKVPPGSYIALVSLNGGQGMKPYPIHVRHGEDKFIHLDFPARIPQGMAFIPAGPFIFGGTESRFYREKVVDLESYFIKDREVTFAEYLEFWKQLSDTKLRQDYRSRVRFSEEERKFYDAWDDAGYMKYPDLLNLDMPVVGITHEAAVAYCAWLSRETGADIHLPTVQQWEKAARGVDGRTYVWGNHLDLRFALTKKNDQGKAQYPFFAPPASFRGTDVSPYNVFDMAGNVREMTSSLLPTSKSVFYQLKGGSASTPDNFLPASYSSDTPVVPTDVGFRYVMEL